MRAQKPRGFILIMSIYVLMVMSILSLSVTTRSLAETMTARQYFWSDSAFSLAEAALDATMSNFRVANFNSVPNTPMGSGTYWTEVTPLPALGPRTYQLIGHGRRESIQRDLEAIVQATPFSVFQYPLFGDQLLDLRGTVETDSYNSNAGLYDPLTAGDNGDLGTNATTNVFVQGPTPDTGVFISGNVTVNGDIQTGEGSDPNAVLDTNGGSYTVSGTTSALSDPLLLPPVIVPAGLTCSDETIESFETLTLGPGEYCFHNLTMGNSVLDPVSGLPIVGPAVLEATGEITIYITGDLVASYNSFIGNTYNPSYTVFQLASPQYQGGLTTEATLAGTTQLYGAIYAPDSQVNLHGTVDIYGSITANTIWQTGTAIIHFDEGLEERDDLPVGGYATDVIYWRDCDPSDGSGCSN